MISISDPQRLEDVTFVIEFSEDEKQRAESFVKELAGQAQMQQGAAMKRFTASELQVSARILKLLSVKAGTKATSLEESQALLRILLEEALCIFWEPCVYLDVCAIVDDDRFVKVYIPPRIRYEPQKIGSHEMVWVEDEMHPLFYCDAQRVIIKKK
jgi:hypothetical protein